MKPRGPFFLVDTLGIPLSIVLIKTETRDRRLAFIWLCEFISSAVVAGWGKQKIVGTLREAANLGADIPRDLLDKLEENLR